MKHVKQVGGSHYQQEGDKPQHWDLVAAYDWDYFQGQIIKYVMRWKLKHPTPEKKVEDLEKARSFLDKYISEYRKFLPAVELRMEGANLQAREVTPETINQEATRETVVCNTCFGVGTLEVLTQDNRLSPVTCQNCLGSGRTKPQEGRRSKD